MITEARNKTLTSQGHITVAEQLSESSEAAPEETFVRDKIIRISNVDSEYQEASQRNTLPNLPHDTNARDNLTFELAGPDESMKQEEETKKMPRKGLKDHITQAPRPEEIKHYDYD